MSIQELERIIKQQESIGSSFAVLSVTKPKSFKLKGLRMRTAFGLCEVYNFREYDDRNEVTVRCEVSKMKTVLEELRNAAE